MFGLIEQLILVGTCASDLSRLLKISAVSLSERLLHGMGRSAPLPGCLERHPRMKGLSASMNLRLQTAARAGPPDAAFSEVRNIFLQNYVIVWSEMVNLQLEGKPLVLIAFVM